MTANRPAAASLMLVDDTPANLALLDDLLTEQGYRVRCFPRGSLALAAAAQELPDLILLDVNMPGMDGFEVCTRLKAIPELAPIPVIFLSALDETVNKVHGFRCGGVDYVTKPFEVEEILARIRTHLELRHLQMELHRQNLRLDDQVQLKTAELAGAHARLAVLDKAKGDFLKLISHELRTPLSGLVGVGELLLEAVPPNPATDTLKALFKESQVRLLKIVDDSLLLAQINTDAGRFPTRLLPVGPILEGAIARVREFAQSRGVAIDMVPVTSALVRGDADLCTQAVHALLETAVKFSQENRAVRLAVTATCPELVLRIESRGRTIPEAALPRFFEVLAISEAIVPGGDLGLAAPLARQILGLFGGSVTVQNVAPPGLRFEVRFQITAAHAAAPEGGTDLGR